MNRGLVRVAALLAGLTVLAFSVWLLLGSSGTVDTPPAHRAVGGAWRTAQTANGAREQEIAGPGGPATEPAPLRFRVTVSPEAVDEIRNLGLETPIRGRVYVIVSRDPQPEPRHQIDLTGVPLWGREVAGLTSEAPVYIEDGDPGVVGYPLQSIADLPPDTYRVQAFLNVYTTLRRADGHTLRMHLNSGAGQSPFRAPGNAHSRPLQVRLDPREARQVDLGIDRVIPPLERLEPGEVLQQGNPRDTERVRFVKIRSRLLSEFWGRDMYIGANVLLPSGYEEQPGIRYPTVYLQGHFPGRVAPFGYGDGADPHSAGFTRFWDSGRAPQVIAVTIRDANPYYDTSYGVNSANVGPYGDAIHQELIPELEDRFRMISQVWARVTAGASTGGWEALASQIFHPDTYGGTWSWCPDPVDFRYFQIVDIYEDANAYWTEYDWVRVERPNARWPDGDVRSTVRMENLHELAVGPNSRSGGQWAIWEAVFGPVGGDGYPAPIWNKRTGEIDREIAAYWRDNYDLNAILQRDWAELGSKLQGQIHVATGDADTYYLEEAVHLLEASLSTVDDPPADASFEYGRREPHCWIGSSPTNPDEELDYAEFLRIAADHVRSNAPARAELRWYR